MIKKLLRSSLVLSSAFAVVVAVAPAEARGEAEGNGIATAPQSSGSASGREKRYCIVSDFTGSRIPVKTCKTRKQWEAEGVEIPSGR